MATYKKSAEMRNNILQAMKHLVLEKGYGKTGIKDIAEYLGIPRSLVYYYFDHKHSIMREIYAQRFSEVSQIVSTVLPLGKEPIVRLMLANYMEPAFYGVHCYRTKFFHVGQSGDSKPARAVL